MILIINKVAKCFFICLCINFAFASHIDTLNNNLHSYIADYTLEVDNNLHQNVYEEHGSIKIKNASKIKILNENKSFIIINDNIMWEYDNEIDQLYRTNLTSHNALNILNDLNNISNYYNIQTNIGNVVGQVTMYLTDKDSGKAIYTVFMQDNKIRKIQFKDSFGNFNNITFTNVRLGSDMDDNEFIFMPSSQIDIVSR